MKGLIKYAPEDFEIKLIGISSKNKSFPLKTWHNHQLGKKKFSFYALFFEKNENKKTLIPLSLRFTLALILFKLNIDNCSLFFNRIEPAILFKKHKCPKIAIIHNDIQQQIQTGKGEVLWNKFPLIYSWFEKYIFQYLHHVFTVSQSTLEIYKSRYSGSKNKFSFLPTWVDTEIFFPPKENKSSIRKSLSSFNPSLSRHSKWILFVGRLQEQKAPIRLIDTFMEYYQKDKTACLVIIGEGNLKNSMEKHINKLQIEDHVIFINNLQQEKLAKFYQASDVLLLTSNYEGMPVCVLEALGCGLPVVSTDVGEVKKVIKNRFSGEITVSLDPISILKSLETVIKNSDIYTCINCLESVSPYTPEKVLKTLFHKIRELQNA
ncbi:MAG: glycosyltransferase [Candidatus Aureabacteria bacterium]|nr:glycosyltransferase [Candidatus Auribacterota bacterium]